MKNVERALIVPMAFVMLALATRSHAAGFVDPLDIPAKMSPLASMSPLQGVARAGLRLVAVG